ncbi:innexin family protein, partial [Aphelenchoides avenae]
AAHDRLRVHLETWEQPRREAEEPREAAAQGWNRRHDGQGQPVDRARLHDPRLLRPLGDKALQDRAGGLDVQGRVDIRPHRNGTRGGRAETLRHREKILRRHQRAVLLRAELARRAAGEEPGVGAVVLGSHRLRDVRPHALHLDAAPGKSRRQLQQRGEGLAERARGERRRTRGGRGAALRARAGHRGQLPHGDLLARGGRVHHLRGVPRARAGVPPRRRTAADDRLRLPHLGLRHRARLVGASGMERRTDPPTVRLPQWTRGAANSACHLLRLPLDHAQQRPRAHLPLLPGRELARAHRTLHLGHAAVPVLCELLQPRLL